MYDDIEIRSRLYKYLQSDDEANISIGIELCKSQGYLYILDEYLVSYNYIFESEERCISIDIIESVNSATELVIRDEKINNYLHFFKNLTNLYVKNRINIPESISKLNHLEHINIIGLNSNNVNVINLCKNLYHLELYDLKTEEIALLNTLRTKAIVDFKDLLKLGDIIPHITWIERLQIRISENFYLPTNFHKLVNIKMIVLDISTANIEPPGHDLLLSIYEIFPKVKIHYEGVDPFI